MRIYGTSYLRNYFIYIPTQLRSTPREREKIRRGLFVENQYGTHQQETERG
jgi:hypothetical protein